MFFYFIYNLRTSSIYLNIQILSSGRANVTPLSCTVLSSKYLTRMNSCDQSLWYGSLEPDAL